MEFSERLREKGITVNAADPGIVSTNIITMHQWFDPLTDLFFRPFIRTPKKGASTAVGLFLDEAVARVSEQPQEAAVQKIPPPCAAKTAVARNGTSFGTLVEIILFLFNLYRDYLFLGIVYLRISPFC